jgi:hypothetical protein
MMRSEGWAVGAIAAGIVALGVGNGPALAQTVSIDELAFMAGSWERTTDGMHVEQVFLPPEGRTMVGLQRRTQDGATLVSYFFVIEESDRGIVCRFKHFENDYSTYEDRNATGPRTFSLVEAASGSATFREESPDGVLLLRYRVTDGGQLGIAVGAPSDFESGAPAESLHDPVG